MSISPISNQTHKTLFKQSNQSSFSVSTEKTTGGEFIEGTRSTTPKIFTSGRMDGNKIPQNQVIMTLFSCKCQKTMAQAKCSLRERLSPTNEEVKINYKGKKFNILLCGDGIYYLVDNKTASKLYLFKEATSLGPTCCSFERIYFRPLFV